MLVWLQDHIFTILICAVLIAFFGWLLYTLIRDRKQGKSSCCGGCAGCALAGQCHAAASKSTVSEQAPEKEPSDSPTKPV